ncbi:MAG: hypothetical protein R8G66_11810 [Cytophagales bacterium]|nr:hypothetical protein [Cytophagales bacterium]
MKDYNIENSINLFHSDKTKEYFREVSSSYYNGNNRAAVVTLYSVVISDLLFKLEFLVDIYNDQVAKEILSKIKETQDSNPTNPDWEKDLVEEILNRTNLLDNVDKAHIQALRNDRHLCAHPVLNKEDKLYTPNPETVASHIRNMIESIFSKPPLLSKKILPAVLSDISDKAQVLFDDESMKKYLVSKYLEKLTDTAEVQIFRDLWKFVFRLDDEECIKNRFINFRFLYILYNRNPKLCISKIDQEPDHFYHILDSPDTINLLIRFTAENEFLYDNYRDDVKQYIINRSKNAPDEYAYAWFLSASYKDHLDKIKSINTLNFPDIFTNDPRGQVYFKVLTIGLSKGYHEEVSEFIVWRYSFVKHYNDGDKVFSSIVSPFLKQLTDKQLIELCEGANNNNQVYDRKKAKEDHKLLKQHIENRMPDFEFEKFKNVFN